MSLTVEAICAGRAALLPGDKRSAIAKSPLEGPVEIGPRGVAGDEQVDRKHHGFPAMAVHLYPADHYAWLKQQFDAPSALAGPGSMGENLFVHGVDETAVCIGDRFRLGTAIIEVSQPRQPCATIERHLGRKGIVKAIVESGRCGMFFRVIEPGLAQAGDTLDPMEQGAPDWTVRRAFHLVYAGGKPDRAELEELASLPRVSDRLVHDIRRKHPAT
ncbi:MOSC domain-containing protein [Erythrobacter sp. YJ-T3-07]|uniref:MOSC domain-containing protein n=1 Tax=Erythrobacter sp. YJ-T3-07 TaxID=2793063 RepID=UPI0018D36A40|nr:MOSC domain-containing protein [Erythrobacter sp. YJ-T3-07]